MLGSGMRTLDDRGAGEVGRAAHSRGLRGAVYLSISLLLHAVIVLALSLGAVRAELRPQLDVVWLDLDNELGRTSEVVAKEPAQPPAEATPQVPPAAEVPEKPKTAPKKKPARRFRTRQVRLAKLAGEQAALILLLRFDRIRNSPYVMAARRLLSVFYDYKTLLWRSDIDPVEDFDALLIATPNPYRVTRTFLAARHDLPEDQLKKAIDRSIGLEGASVRWRREPEQWVGVVPTPPRLRHDRRRVILRERLLMVADPALQRSLQRSPSSVEQNRPAAGGGPSKQTGVDLLARLDDEGGAGKRGPALMLQALNVSRLIELPPGIPPPRNVQVTVPATDPVRMHGLLTFAKRAEARIVARELERTLKELSGSLMLIALGYHRLLGRIEVRTRGRRVDLQLRLAAEAVIPLLGMLGDMIPQVRVPGMQPRVQAPARSSRPSAASAQQRPSRRR
jgi:hypothetical protein